MRDNGVSGYCSARCVTRQKKSDDRAFKRSRVGESFTLREIAQRDGWRCHLCGGKVPDQEWTANDNDPTMDHLVPVSKGGVHERWNVALAHNRCNWERGNADIEFQVRLIA
jgi:5-methylcytosine-specific restriction endonuclease McrA